MTLDRCGGGPDDSFSLERPELEQLCQDTKTAWEALGSINYERKESEKGNMVFRRSLYVVEDIKSGDTFTIDNVRSIRPGYGLQPKELPSVMGKVATVDIQRGTALSREHISNEV